MKKTWLIALLLVAFTPIFAFEYTYEGNTLEYTILTDNTVSVKAGSKVPKGALIIPSEVDAEGAKYTVTVVDSNAFNAKTQITSIVLPSTIKLIRFQAFRSLPQSLTITLNDGLETIGNRAFCESSGLNGDIYIPSSVTSIEEFAFYHCSNVKIHMPSAVPPTLGTNGMAKGPFVIVPCGSLDTYKTALNWSQVILVDECTPLKTHNGVIYQLNDDMTAIVIGTTIELPTNFELPATISEGGNTYVVNELADKCFTSALSLQSVILSDNIVEISTDAFRGCPKLESVVLGQNTETIGTYAFCGCNKLKSVQFNNKLSTIKERAFQECVGLISLVLPSSIVNIELYAFFHAISLQSVELLATNPPKLASQDVFSWRSNAPNYPANYDIIVPCESYDTYLLAKKWNLLAERLVPKCAPVEIYHNGTPKSTEGVYQVTDDLVGKITYKRIFTPGAWETLYLPFEVEKVTIEDDGEWELIPWDINSGGHYYIAEQAGVVDGELCFDFTNTLEAHTPYIIQFPNSGGYYNNRVVTFHGAATWNDLSTSFSPLSPTTQMQMGYNNTLQNQTISDEVYILRGTTDFMLQHSATTLYPFECYVMPQQTTGAALAPKMTVRLRGKNDVTTSISSTQTNQFGYTKDGNVLTVYSCGQPLQIYSISGELLYDVENQESAQFSLDKGCYIIYSNGNSQKVIL